MNKGNVLKTPLGPSLNRIALGRIADAIQVAGKALPCTVVKATGAIVAVNFEINSGYTLPQVVVPSIGAQWLRLPLQPGDLGVVFPADVYLGGVSGLGGGVADLTKRANLTALVFAPIGSNKFSAVSGNQLVGYGPAGVQFRDAGSASVINLTPTGITLSFGGHSIVLNNAGITLDGVLWDTHQHSYIPGSGMPILTGGPVA